MQMYRARHDGGRRSSALVCADAPGSRSFVCPFASPMMPQLYKKPHRSHSMISALRSIASYREHSMPKCNLSIGWAVSACLLAMTSSAGMTDAALAAATCIQNPDRQADPGSHWYYRLDHVNDRRCWYLKKSGSPRRALDAGAGGLSRSGRTPPTFFPGYPQWSGRRNRPGVLPTEEAAATRNSTGAPTPKAHAETGSQNAERPDSAKVLSRKPQQPSPQPLTRSDEPATALPFDAARREALFREFLQWRERQLFVPLK